MTNIEIIRRAIRESIENDTISVAHVCGITPKQIFIIAKQETPENKKSETKLDFDWQEIESEEGNNFDMWAIPFGSTEYFWRINVVID